MASCVCALSGTKPLKYQEQRRNGDSYGKREICGVCLHVYTWG